MSKTSEKGPKQVDKTAYKDLMKEQAQQHADFIANSGSNTQQPDSPVQKEGWRKNFGSVNNNSDQYQNPTPATTQPQFAIEEVKLSKHAKRRAKKKQKIVVCEGADTENQ